MKGKKVTIIEALDKLMAVNGPLCSANKEMLERLIPFNGVEVVTGARVTGFKDGVLTATVGEDTKELKADSVVLCVGYSSENTLYEKYKNELDECYLLGDAKNVANIMYGIWDAFEVANHID
jgi:2-enoate reductase